MPGGDQTGPMGTGPMSGRGLGYCAGYNAPGYVQPGGFGAPGGFGGQGGFGGRGGFGRGRGGRGFRNRFRATGLTGWQRAAMDAPAYGVGPYAGPAPMAPNPTTADPAQTDELAVLKNQLQFLKGTIDNVQQRISELETQATQADTATEKES